MFYRLTSIVLLFSVWPCFAFATTPTYEPVAAANEVFVVYNSSYTTDSNSDTVQDSLEIANYYKTARSIPDANVVGIAAPTTEAISRADYNTYIKAGIESALTSAGLENTIKYIVLTKGIPMKIQDTGSVADNYFITYGNHSSVDGAVTLLYQNYSKAGTTLNPYRVVDQSQSLEYRFKTNHFFDASTGITLKYLVTRLDGYTVADIKGMIDRAVAADTTGSGYYVLDHYSGSYNHSDTTSSAHAILDLLGKNIHPDPYSTGSSAITTAPGSVIGYIGHGIYGGLPNDYYNTALDFTYLNGAVASTYESHAAFSMTAPDTTNHGQLAQFIAAGGSGGIGNVYEPYSDAIALENYLLPMYAIGYTWADAAYMSLRYLDWTTIVLGDPLMRINLATHATTPTIVSVTSDKNNGTYATGEVIDVEITFSEPVTSTGNVTVTFETGATDRTCTFTITASILGTCNYTVQTGDSTSDLTVSSINGTIMSMSNVALSNFTPATNLAASRAIVVDTATAATGPTTNGGWTTQTGVGSRYWSAVAASSDGTKLVAASNEGYIYTSTDSGTTWTIHVSAGSRAWSAVAASSDGTKLVAVVDGGYVYTSTDSGATWIARVNAGARQWKSVVLSADGTKIAAVPVGYIYTSTDSGATWTEQTSSGSRTWVSISSSTNGAKLAATTSNNYIYTSTNSGATWTQQTNLASRVWNQIASSSDGAKLAVVAFSGHLYTSTDSGVTWTQTSAGSRAWRSITSSADGTKIAAAVNDGYIYISTDSGANWTTQIAATTKPWTAIAYSSDGEIIVAGASPGDIYTYAIDITAPTITAVSSDKVNGSYAAGEVIDIDVTFSETVTSTGSVIVTLETGITDRTCTFTVTDSTTGTCNYAVQAGDESADLTVTSISGTILDTSSNPMTNFVPTTNLAANKALVIDAIVPTVTGASGGGGGGGSSSRLPVNSRLSPLVLSTTVPAILMNTLNPGMYDKTALIIAPITRTLKPGAKDVQVMTLQKFLKLKADGKFGPITLKAVKEFQLKNNLVADGVVGPKTLKIMSNILK